MMMTSNTKLIQYLIKNKKFRTYIKKYFLVAASMAVAAFIVYVIASYMMYSVFFRDALSRFQEKNIIKTNEFVDYVFQGIDQASSLISGSEIIVKPLIAKESTIPDSSADSSVDSSADSSFIVPEGEEALRRSDIKRAIDSLFQLTVLTPSLESIYIYSFANDYVLSWTDFRPLESFPDPDFLDIYSRDYQFYTHENSRYSQEKVITLIEEVIYKDQIIGIAAFNIKYSVFAGLVGQSFELPPEAIFLTDTYGQIFYSTNEKYLNTNIQNYSIYDGPFSKATNDTGNVMFSGGWVITSMRSDNNRYIVLSCTESNEISEFQNTFIRFLLIGIMATIAMVFLIAFIMSFRFYRNTIRFVSRTNFQYGDLNEAGINENSFITENILSLAAMNSQIGLDLAEKLAELKKAQSIALQTQINPHFILNALQIVSLDFISQMKTDSNATKIISLLTDIFQSNLDTTNYIIPLSYELRQGAKYLEIERIRHNGTFRTEWDVDEGLHGYATVKFILQPIMENCFKHGLVNSPENNKHISIKAYLESGVLTISVWDSGEGIPQDVLINLQNSLKETHIKENSHIGLNNVDKRIKLVFGDSFGVSITSEPGKGTKVVIRQKAILFSAIDKTKGQSHTDAH